MKKIILLTVIIFISFLLRYYKLGSIPPSLYWDEASLGYNAYTIATSLRDEHGSYLPLDRFIAFGDYKPPGYIYSAVPSVILLGLNEFSIRLPSMLAGFLMVVITYLLVKELFHNKSIALLSSLLLAISPWAIQFSRAAFEANLAACFNLLGIYFFILATRKKWLLLPAVVFFVFSFYTFNANRIIAPLLLTGLALIYLKSISQNIKWLIISIIIAVILLSPSINYLKDRESRLRFQEVSIFNNLEPIKISNERIAFDNNTWWAKLIHNRRIIFAADFLKHYFDNFSGRFLFTHGDVNPRLSIQEMGELYVWDLPFLLLGLFILVKKREKASLPIFIWMLVAPIPAATARETPHALRILSILPTFQIIIAYGLYHFSLWIKNRFAGKYSHFLFFILCFMLSANLFYYLHNYYTHYSIIWGDEWQYGYKQMVSYVAKVADNYDHIFVTDTLGRPYIYFAFYKPYPLTNFLKEREASRDWFGFWNVSALGKIRFEFSQLSQASGKVLLVTTPGNLPSDFSVLTSIKNLSGRDIFLIAQKT